VSRGTLLPVFVVGKVSREVDPEIKSREPIGESARGDRWRADYECAVFQSAEEFQSNLIKEGVMGNNRVHEKTRDTYPASHDSGNTWQLQTGSLRSEMTRHTRRIVVYRNEIARSVQADEFAIPCRRSCTPDTNSSLSDSVENGLELIQRPASVAPIKSGVGFLDPTAESAEALDSEKSIR